jgi:hypothetical protein
MLNFFNILSPSQSLPHCIVNPRDPEALKGSNTSSSNGKENPSQWIINGVSMSFVEIQEVSPLDRSIAHWAVLVDWDLQRQRPYVIVDPYDPQGLLYLSRTEYLAQMKVCASNDLTLVVVARPGSKQPTPSPASSQNSPPSQGEPFDSGKFFNDKSSRLTWRAFLKLRDFVSRNVERDAGMVTVSSTTVVRTALLWARQLLHYMAVKVPEFRLGGINPFCKNLEHITKSNGVAFMSKRLKVAMFAVYSYLGGNPLETTEPLGIRIRLRSGLPEMIPRAYRDLIRQGEMKWIRFWVSMLNIYRTLDVKTPDPETAYLTIRKPPLRLDNLQVFEEWLHFCKEIWPSLVASHQPKGNRPYYKYTHNRGLIIRSASVNLSGSVSLLGIILDAQAWAQAPVNWPVEWFNFHGDSDTSDWISKISSEPHLGSYRLNDPKDRSTDDDFTDEIMSRAWVTPEGIKRDRYEMYLKSARASGALIGHCFDASKPAREVANLALPIVGRLFNFAAPGGKLRTVAICDYWTQLACKSVHDYLFQLLKTFPSDGTFDQQGVVDAYWKRGLKPHWSYDLKAATDTIPLDLYIYCLAPLLQQKGETYEKGLERARLWSKLLTDREFAIPSPRKGEQGHNGCIQYRTIRYATGQPMGALSSWASLAIVHHALVQFAHWQSTKDKVDPTELSGPFDGSGGPVIIPPNLEKSMSWFESYLILGDDVDIATDRRTAEAYTSVCTAFGITIGLEKSLQSRENFFEFANQRFHPKGNISPISFTEELSSSESWSKRVEFANRIVKRFDLGEDETNLVRLICTARQWQALIPEFSGMRSRVLLRILRFILLNPLRPFWFAEEKISIDAIRKWLANLLEVVAGQASTGDAVRLEIALSKLIKAEVQRKINAMKAAVPKSLVYYAYEPLIEQFFTRLGDKHRVAVWEPVRGRPYVLPKAKYAWSYIEYCVNRHNEELFKRLRTFEMQNWKLLSMKMHLVHLAPDPQAAMDDQVDLAKWVRLYLQLGDFALPIVFNYEAMGKVFHTEPSEKAKVEHAEGLLKIITPLIAEHLGYEITGVPYFPLKGARGASWNRKIKRFLDAFKTRKSAYAASLNPTGLRTRWFSEDGSLSDP